jgi:hypothetical protein
LNVYQVARSKNFVRLIRVIFALLLPAVWLAVAVGSFGEPAPVAGLAARCQSEDAADAHSSEFFGQSSASEAVLVYHARRHRPESACPSLAAQHLIKSAWLSCSADDCVPHTVEVLSLARTWQFRFRAAANPRAPSCLF